MNRFATLCFLCLTGLFIANGGAVAGPPADKEKGANCSDGIDNDGDGQIDGDDPDCNGGGGGISEEGPGDFFFHSTTSEGVTSNVRGDGVFPNYAADAEGQGSCHTSFVTIRGTSQGQVKLFVPGGDCSTIGFNRWIEFDGVDFDLDQDGRCVIGYTGHPDSPSLGGCTIVAQETESAMATLHFFGAYLEEDGDVVDVRFQIRRVEYVGGAVDWVGAQERAYNITYVNPANVTIDAADPDLRTIEATPGLDGQGDDATICEVVYKKRKRTCVQITSGGSPVVLDLPFRVTVDRTPDS